MADLRYETIIDPSQENIEPIDQGLHEFNLSYLGEEIIYNYHRVAILARDETGTVIGGVHGELCWEWLYIKSLWVDERQRGRGIGKQLLADIEGVAALKGFCGSHLETTDFQALAFYLKEGYEIFGELEGKPAGSTWYFIKKRF